MLSNCLRLSRLAAARALIFSSIAILSLSFVGCHPVIKDPKDPRFIVAETKTWTITRGELTTEMTRFVTLRHRTMKDIDPATMARLEQKIMNDIVLKKLILERAATLPPTNIDAEVETTFANLKKQAPSEAEFEAKLKSVGMTDDDLKQEMHDEIIIEKYLKAEVLKDTEPSAADIHTFYQQNQEKMGVPAKVRVSRIIIIADNKTSAKDRAAKKKAIEAARARVAKGEDFAKVASEVSEDHASAQKGGDMGYLQPGQNEAAFEQMANATKVGTVSPVFETTSGYQFLKVIESTPAKTVSETEARESIAQYLRKIKQGFALHFYTSKLIADSGVKYHLASMNPPPAPGQHSIGNRVSPPPTPATNGPSTAPPPPR